MNSKRQRICRLCLKIAKEEFWIIDELVKQTFDVFLLKLDFGVTRDPIVCQSCVEIVKKCLSFKSTCIDAEKTILSFSIGSKNNNHSIKDIYKERERLVKVDDEDLDICRFCLARLRRNNVIPLDMLMNDTMFEMLIENMPELDFIFIDAPIICKTCRKNLVEYFKFIQNSLEIEEKIRGRVRAYCTEEGTVGVGQVKLDMLHFLFKDILEYPSKCQQILESEGESNMCKDTACLYPEACSELIKIDTKEINLEEDSYKNLLEERLDKYGNMSSSGSSDMLIEKHEVISEADIYKHTASKEKGGMIRHEIVQKDLSSPRNYVSGHKNDFEKKMYRCPFCTYEARKKSVIQMHMLVHKEASETIMYECTSCPYKSKYKQGLKRHTLVHKDVCEIEMFKCALCAFESKYKDILKRHVLVHRDISEIEMYKCSFCVYQAKRKSKLTQHMILHKDVSDIKMYKCPLCPYEAKLNCYLKRHMLVHKDVSEIEMYKCSLCAYEAKDKGRLSVHMLVHKDVSELKMYKCSLCKHETKYRNILKRHMLIHEDVSELKMYKCSFCAYEARYKEVMERHIMFVHKDISETKMYKCSLCAFESKYKNCFKRHMQRHMQNK